MTATVTPTGLDAAQRTQLERLVTRARAAFEADLSAQAEGRFGIHADGTIEDEQALPDDASDRATRRDLVEIVDHICSLGESRPDAVARLLREAAFTHLNRLLAIRIAEAIGLLPESLTNGRQSRGFKDLGEIMPILSDDYWGYILLCGDELAADTPALFDPRNPLLALAPSTPALEEIVALLGERAATPVWLAPDTLGWAYQFFNTADERRSMREAGGGPRTSRELAVRNQFFTPRYVVDFLVQNTLGRRLIDSDPTSPLLHELPLLVDPPTSPGAPLDLNDTRVLDPACGSGHFLLGCYDLLERAWQLQAVSPSESAPAIVASLWGVDIDPRCAQVASAAVVLRARRHCRELPLPKPNIVTARSLPPGSSLQPTDLGLGHNHCHLVERVSEVLADAPLLGTLLKAEDLLEQEIRHAAFGGAAGTLPLTDDGFRQVEADLMAHLQAAADQASSSVAERLLAAEADDALRLVDVVRNRYDAVLMNPPFGEPVARTKPYLRAAYPWMPGTVDLFAAFVGRGLELCKPDGYLGAITSRAGLFLSSFETWRRDIILGNRLVTLVDLGYKVMEQALVEAAAYVVAPRTRHANERTSFIRLLRTTDRPRGLVEVVAADRGGLGDRRVFRLDTSELEALPRAVIAYWMAPSIRRLFTELPRLEGNGATARSGVSTGDDFRFVRAFWEVNPHTIARTRAGTSNGKRWCPFAKGGEYSPYWSDIHLVVDYQEDGARLREFGGAYLRNPGYYFQQGLTWPARTASGFSPRVLPAGCVFGHKGPTAFAIDSDPLIVLSWLRTRLANALLKALLAAADEMTSENTSKSFEVGHIGNLPWPGELLDADDRERMRHAAADIANSRASLDAVDETSRRFMRPFPRAVSSVAQGAEQREQAQEDHALQTIELSGGVDALIEARVAPGGASATYLDEEVGPRIADLPMDTPFDDTLIPRYWEMDLVAVIYELMDMLGGDRVTATKSFVADRRLELLASAFDVHPRRLVQARRTLGVLPKDTLRETAADCMSYAVGCAFGRWDARIGRGAAPGTPTPEIFDPVPLCAPGMLVDDAGYPATTAPAGYPLEIPAHGLLVDEPGHPQDVAAVLSRALVAIFHDPVAVEAELLEILSRKTTRDYLRKQFFKDHLSRYSKSRRKAPIYWQLSVPSKTWGVWVYTPTLSRETLYAVGAEAARRERLAIDAIARLQGDQRMGEADRSARKVAEELDLEEKLVEELRRFRTEAERIAGLGWEPNVDDGIVLCAAPLAELFPAWPDAKKARNELRKGDHEWASVARWAAEL